MEDDENPERASQDLVASARKRLARFLEANKASGVEASDEASSGVCVTSPWGDPSLALRVPTETIDSFAATLNEVYLPERYTAIWHRDTKDLEVIFTALTLREHLGDLPERRFVFQHRARDYICEYGPSSERLLEIAAASYPIAQSSTEFRNLQSFQIYLSTKLWTTKEAERVAASLGAPLCFWIRSVEWDEDAILTLIGALNFYMTYFDTRSPTIVVHSPKIESFVNQPQTRYTADKFPTLIKSREIDDNMLRFWMASRTGDPASRFLYSYRIIEYASFFYLESAAKAAIRKCLAAPNALEDVQKLTEHVLGALQETKLEAPQKFDSVVRETLNPSILWREIFRNLGAFTKPTLFEGGYVLEPIANEKWTERDFGVTGIDVFSKRLRDIRNALSHGRDQKTTHVITPTTHNFERLQPWTSLVAVAAGEVIVYRDV